MRLEHQITHPRLLRRAVRGDGAAAQSDTRRGTPSGASRFLDATLLDQGRKLAILKALASHKIGDETGREIFVAAVEYQLTAFGDRLGRGPQPREEPDHRGFLAETAELTRAVEDRLDAVPEPALRRLADRLGPAPGDLPSALCELRCELAHLRRACDLAVAAISPDPLPEADLVAEMARAFEACFEQPPTAAAGGPFATALELLAQETDLPIPHSPGLLAAVLSGTPAQPVAAKTKRRR